MSNGRINSVRWRIIFVGSQCVTFIMLNTLARRISKWLLDFRKHSVLHAKKKKKMCQVFVRFLHIQVLWKHPVHFHAFVISLCNLHLREDVLGLTMQPFYCERQAAKLDNNGVGVHCNASNKI